MRTPNNKVFFMSCLLFLFGFSFLPCQEKTSNKDKGTEIKKVLIFRNAEKRFSGAWKSLQEEIGKDYSLKTVILNDKGDYASFEKAVRSFGPSLIIALDDRAVTYSKQFHLEKDKYAKNLPVIASLALNLNHRLKNDPKICGVIYEVPIFSIVTEFKFLVEKEIKNVLVYYRKSKHEENIVAAKKQLKLAGVNLIAKNVEEKGEKPKEINRFIFSNMKRDISLQKVDAFLLMADNAIINRVTFEDWVEISNKSKVPFICNIWPYVEVNSNFCVFSSSPKFEDLGIQVADMVFSILEDGESPDNIRLEYLLAVQNTVNSRKLKRLRFKIKDTEVDSLRILRK